MREPLLSIRGLSKTFGGARALIDVDLDLYAGEIHGLLGQNGSGKSTLIKILGGYHSPDAGTVMLNGLDLQLPIARPQDHGIAIIHQDLGLVDSMSVLENVGISDGYGCRGLRPISWGRVRRETSEVMQRLGAHLDLDARLGTLSPSDHSIVAVVRALRLLSLSAEAHIFILDEPTAYLGPAESERVLATMRAVANHGAAVVFVSHKMGEVIQATDRCTVLRDGQVVTTAMTAETKARDLVTLQLGREMGDFYPPLADLPRDDVVLEVVGLCASPATNVDLHVRSGEIVGLTGLVGMGQDAVIEAIAGARNRDEGVIRRPGRDPLPAGVRAATSQGVALVPADRKRDGLWLDATSVENFALPSAVRARPWSRLAPRREYERARGALAQVGVQPLRPGDRTGALSGGNQQKVLMAKWLADAPDVLLLHEPTQGVDAGARRDILALVNQTAGDGVGVVVCSTDYEQLAAICHRVLVLRDGVVAEELHQPLTEESLLLACQGTDENTGERMHATTGWEN